MTEHDTQIEANITYCSDELVDFYSSYRRTWEEIYPSEKTAFQWIAKKSGGSLGHVLDVGCAAGGLCLALAGNISLASYCGVDIHAGLIKAARTCETFPMDTEFHAGDVCCLPEMEGRTFDTVVSLGCADWNVRLEENIASCWQFVRPGGSLLVTLRLTPGQSWLDPAISHQFACFEDALPENTDGLDKAPYMVLNLGHAMSLLSGMQPAPSTIFANGYWGQPSAMAVTPAEKVVFAALALTKPDSATDTATSFECDLPADLFITCKP